MTKAEDVLRKCLSGKKLNVDKCSRNKKHTCEMCGGPADYFQHIDKIWVCEKCDKETFPDGYSWNTYGGKKK